MSTNSTQPAHFTVNTQYQSYGLSFEAWTDFFTIVLAPLIAHIVAGAPKIVFLCETVPRWHDRIALYNPVSIVWRYMTIAERCLCSKDLDKKDIAITNVALWTERGWDGSEETMRSVHDLCVRPALPVLDRLLSSDSIKTIIVSAQGAAAIVSFLPNANKSGSHSYTSIFLPLSLLGLLRLPAAWWLTDDHVIANRIDRPRRSDAEESLETRPPYDEFAFKGADVAVEPMAASPLTLHPRGHGLMKRGYNLKLLPRTLYGVYILGAAVLLFYRLTTIILSKIILSLSILISDLFYAALIISLIVILPLCMVKYKSTTTMIPCANTIWYKVHSAAVLLMFIFLLVSSACQVWVRNGEFTSTPRPA